MILTKAVSKIEVSAGVPSLLFQRQKFGFTQVDRAHRRKIKKLSFGAFALHSDEVFLDKKFSFSQLHRHATTTSFRNQNFKDNEFAEQLDNVSLHHCLPGTLVKVSYPSSNQFHI